MAAIADRRRIVTVAVAAVALVLAACAPDRAPRAATASSSEGPAESVRHPYGRSELDPSLPNTIDALAPFYVADLTSLGVHLTRAAMYQLDAGPHLQLYVQPDRDPTAGAYLDRVVPLTRVIAPSSFARWPTLATFDICQEPFGADSSPSTPPVTVVYLTRAQVDAVPWSTATIDDLRAVVDRMPGGELTINVDAASH